MLSSWAKLHSQPVNLPGAWPLMKPLFTTNNNNENPSKLELYIFND